MKTGARSGEVYAVVLSLQNQRRRGIVDQSVKSIEACITGNAAQRCTVVRTIQKSVGNGKFDPCKIVTPENFILKLDIRENVTY